MNKISVLLIILSIAQYAYAITAAEREAIIQRSIEKQGGQITIAPTGNVFRIVNAQKSLPPTVFDPMIADIRKIGIDIPFEVSDATSLTGMDPLALARSAALTKKTGALVAIVEVKDYPTLLAAPENGFTIINLYNLKADKTTTERLKERLTKEVWRGIAYALGAANSVMGSCVLQPVISIEELDHMRAKRFGADATIRVANSLSAHGIGTYERITYSDACELGIAPAPTNDLQKSIWERAHTPPTNPLKIEFDPATQKGKVTK